MKFFCFIFIGMLTSLTATAEIISASVSDNDILSVTLQTDGCNNYSIDGLLMEPSCQNGITKNIVTHCEAQLSVTQTLMACPADSTPGEVTLQVPLEGVSPLIESLTLNDGANSITIALPTK